MIFAIFSRFANSTNTGDVAGKGVAQIYVSLPWEKGQVEKSHVQLVGFDKTQVLQPGASETLTITVSRDYFSSYDYITEKAYVLDAGEYKFYLSENAHSWAEIAENDSTKVWSQVLMKKIVYSDAKDGKRTTDLVTATNAMDGETNYKFKKWNEGSTGDGYIHSMSRENFKDSFPTKQVFWQREKDSNPHKQSQSLSCYPYTIPLSCPLERTSVIIADFVAMSTPYLPFFKIF